MRGLGSLLTVAPLGWLALAAQAWCANLTFGHRAGRDLDSRACSAECVANLRTLGVRPRRARLTHRRTPLLRPSRLGASPDGRTPRVTRPAVGPGLAAEIPLEDWGVLRAFPANRLRGVCR